MENKSSDKAKSADKIDTFVLENGLQIICQQLPSVDYVAANLIFPGGIIQDPEEEQGSVLLLAELLSRGAGELSSREILSAFDEHGIRHGESASMYNLQLRTAFLPDKSEEALRLLSLLVTKPNFPQDAIEPCKSLFLHEIHALKENPSRWAMQELSKRYYPAPYNRSSIGEESGILKATRDSLTSQWQNRFGASGAVLSIAGKVDSESLSDVIEKYFGGWSGLTDKLPEVSKFPERGTYYIPSKGAQQQLVLIYPSAPMGHKHYYTAKVFSQILSGGMFGRLFIEVREKRGLCYSVYASHSGRPEFGSLVVYAGTTPERVHEPYDVMQKILANPLEGLTESELDRAKNNLLSQIILSEESTSAQSRSNGSDWLLLGRVRSLEEIQEAISSVTEDELQDMLAELPLVTPASLTLGARNFADWKEVNV